LFEKDFHSDLPMPNHCTEFFAVKEKYFEEISYKGKFQSWSQTTAKNESNKTLPKCKSFFAPAN